MFRILIISLFSASLFAITNLEVAKKSEAVMNGFKDSKSDMIMTLINANNQKRTRKMKMIILEKKSGDKSLMTFLSPADVKGTKFLNYEHVNKDDDQWLYLPALKKVKRIPSSDKSSSFMGSDFSYYDMTKRDLQDYDFKLLKETKVRGKKAWMIEATPRSSKVIKESGYTKTIGIVRQDNYVLVRSIGFLKNGKKKYLDIKRLHKSKGIWLIDEMSMTTKKGKAVLHKTTLKFKNIKLNKAINSNMFTTRRLSKGM